MNPGSRLVLRREALSALDGDELVAVAGAATSYGGCTTALTCGATSPVYTVTSRCTEYCEPELPTHGARRCHS